MYLGIDLGTSGVKVVLIDEYQQWIGQYTATLPISRPNPLWSEQNPENWWEATQCAMLNLRSAYSKQMAAVKAIGLSGQMHGATLLDGKQNVLRPAILWNDGRSYSECSTLEKTVPHCRKITGNRAMPGFTAPKLLWVAKHEPDVFARIDKVLLPKDYLRLKLSGNFASDMSDSAGTLWMDVQKRSWSEEMLTATQLTTSSMPELFEGSQVTGKILPGIASDWGLSHQVLIAAGGSDNAAGAVGVGVVEPGQALISLGTSGVYFTAENACRMNPDKAVHAFCHALPNRWHQMSVILSAASCLSWVVQLTGAKDEAHLLSEIAQSPSKPNTLIFLPYLAGERTPHNDPFAQGVFFGANHDTTRADLGKAVLEGVAFAFADAQNALGNPQFTAHNLSVMGGGARSEMWGEILASALERPLSYRKGGELGPSFGAARLARMAHTGEKPESVCTPPALEKVIEPQARKVEELQKKLPLYRDLYQKLKPLFAASSSSSLSHT